MEKQLVKEEIIQKALVFFSKYNYKKTTMEDIAKMMDMTKSNLYYYFTSKKHLYQQCVAYSLDKWRLNVKKHVEAKTSACEKFRSICSESLTYVQGDLILQGLIESDEKIFVLSHQEDRFINVNSPAEQMLIEVLQYGIERGEFRQMDIGIVAEYLFSSYMMFLIKAYVKKDSDNIFELWNAFIEINLRGIIKK